MGGAINHLTWAGIAIFLHLDIHAQQDWANNIELCDYQTSYQLVFHDEFIGDAVDPNKWTTYAPFSWDGSDHCVSCRAPEGADEIFMDDQVQVLGGNARITLWKTPTEWMGQSRSWRSGILFSRQPYKFNKGKFEIRCKIPGKPSTWPAFWLFGEGGNEIDVFEFCSEEINDMLCSVHRTAPQDPPLHYTHHATISSSIGFHTYGIEWLDDWVIWYFDGTEVHRRCRVYDLQGEDCTLNGPFWGHLFPSPGCKLNVLASMGRGGMCLGPPTSETYFDFFIDHIRVWQNAGEWGPQLSNVCAEPMRIVSIPGGGDSFCSPGTILSFALEGPHGDPIVWSLGGSGTSGLEILESSNTSCTVRCNSLPGDGYMPILRAYDPENPCSGGGRTVELALYLGKPYIGPLAGNQNSVFDCPSTSSQYQYWCIQPEVRGAKGLSPYPVQSFTTYYGAIPVYNDYDYWLQDEPEPQPSIGYSSDGYRPYQVYVDEVEHTRIFRPEHAAEYSEQVTILGKNCSYPPLGCQEHWTNWAYGLYPYQDGPFCLVKQGDFCHTIRIVAQNDCGVVESTFDVLDRCVHGPCDLLDPGGTDLAELVSVYPAPSVDAFTISVDELISLEDIELVRVTDAMLNEKFVSSSMSTRDVLVAAYAWPPGIYYVTVMLRTGQQVMKVQIR